MNAHTDQAELQINAPDDGVRPGELLMDVKNVSLSFGGVKAITNISFDVRKGEIRAIIGPNGAGKTSMLNVINGFYTPQQGTIVFRGVERRRMKPHHAVRQGITRTFQNVALFKGMSTLDNIMAGRSVHMNRGLGWQMLWHGPALREEIEHREKVEEIIDFLEIQHIRNASVATLSYGLQKRVELARALAMRPRILMLDEPVAGMNREETEDMARFILDVKEEWGVTILMVEHDMGMVMDISDHVVVLNFGQVIASGTPREVQGNEAVIAAYLGAGDVGELSRRIKAEAV